MMPLKDCSAFIWNGRHCSHIAVALTKALREWSSWLFREAHVVAPSGGSNGAAQRERERAPNSSWGPSQPLLTSRGNKRDKLKGTDRAKVAVLRRSPSILVILTFSWKRRQLKPVVPGSLSFCLSSLSLIFHEIPFPVFLSTLQA